MLLKKVNSSLGNSARYYISGGLNWIPLPESIKTRADIDKYYNQYYFKDKGDSLVYATENHLKARYYEVGWWQNTITKKFYPHIKIDERHTSTMDKPFASDFEITAYLKQRAKAEGLEAVIHFIDPRPVNPDDED